MMEFDLTGLAYSPINPSWPAIGPMEVSFDIAGGHAGVPGQVLDATVTNFKLVLNGSPYTIWNHAVGDYYLSSGQSGLGIFVGDQEFIWHFSGNTWTVGVGTLRTEMAQINFSFAKVKTTSVSEPATIVLGLMAAVLFYSVSRHRFTKSMSD